MTKYESLKEVTVNGNGIGARNVFDADPESDEIKQLLADGAIKEEGSPDPEPAAPAAEQPADIAEQATGGDESVPAAPAEEE